ncbi:hypothetical protein Goarm_020694, partial [Gossypium armourianum]|nr:hypothetical protein [Gossypium armourianum]
MSERISFGMWGMDKMSSSSMTIGYKGATLLWNNLLWCNKDEMDGFANIDDFLGWIWDRGRCFSIKSAYESLSNDQSLVEDQRQRRHMTNDLSCSICGGAMEDTSHVLCTCFVAAANWSQSVKGDKLDEFLSIPIKDWVFLNLANSKYFSRDLNDWDILFGVVCWSLCNHQ